MGAKRQKGRKKDIFDNPAFIAGFTRPFREAIRPARERKDKSETDDMGISWGKTTRIFRPMLDFKKNVAYVTTLLTKEENGYPTPHTIGSDRSIVETDGDALSRWEPSYVKQFLDGNNSVNLRRLFSDIVKVYKSYVFFEEKDSYPFIALWIMGTYLYPLFPAYPMILLNGLKNSGKSRTLLTSSCLAFNAKVIGDPTSATLFRYVDRFRSSLFFDDTEWLANRKSTRMSSILKISYKRGARVPRVGKHKDGSLNEYEVYSPKMFTNIGGIENVLGDRTIIIHQRRKSSGYKIEKTDPVEEGSQWSELRHRLYLFMFDYWKQVEHLIPKQRKIRLENREYELYAGILSIAQLVEKEGKVRGLYDSILRMACKHAKERECDDKVFNREAVAMVALLSLVKKDAWYPVSDIMANLQNCHVSAKGINEEATASILKALGIGQKPGLKKRFRVGQAGKRLMHYFITKREVQKLAKRHGILDEE